ncbi:MAG TPA: hypothetical protein VGQ41_25165 [Pyrinomonadaceae bacterium]|jgi:hypothetical protein|nr:hypothetical protein [Pyrinomonadaceae bacterium]
MKSCPKCNRTFPDEGQKFCTFDGGLLIAPQTFDPNATIRATSIDLNAASERPTSRDLPDPNATIIENYPATVALPRNTGPTGTTPNTSDIPRPPAPPPPPPPVAATPPPAPPPPAAVEPSRVTTGEIAVQQPAVAPSAPLPPVAKKKSKLPWIIAGVLLFLLLGGGALAGVFFFVVKPRLDEMAAERNPNRPLENTNASKPTPASTVESSTPAPTPEDNFVPPPGAVQFVNSKDNLDGVLADHYFDFSFYYPKTWQSDPKAGVPGATNFVKVERRIPPDFTQENFVVRWYASSGTLAGDLQSLPQKVEEFSSSLAKSFPEYRKVSEGATKVNSMDAYEFRWEGLSKGTEKGDLRLWGRVIFLPTGKEGDATGAILSMFTTSLAPELSSVEDVGEHGEAPLILESFRFGKK